jgi:hypothetical protein
MGLALALLTAAACSEEAVVDGASATADSANAGDTAPMDSQGQGSDAALADVVQADTAIADGSTVDAAVEDTTPAPDLPPPDTGPACKPDHCLIGGECLANLAKHPSNVCLRCVAALDQNGWSPWDGGTDGQGSCDDGDPCSVNDQCSDGKCTGPGKVCDDANPCTDDKCDLAGGCTATANSDPCDDGSVCTGGDTCKGGLCLPGAQTLSCDDGNLCTDDGCDPKKGCTLAANSTPCDDGSACTEGDLCKDAACAPGKPANCDDGTVCTIDSCDAKKGCGHKSIADLCVDSNPCTDEACDAKKGCVFPFNTKPCDDVNKCTQNDTCSQGACVGAAVPLDDANTCTDDSCNPQTGVVHTANTLPCDDANACTLEDTCGASSCQPGKKPLVCDDNNLCTDDGCDPKKGCTLANNTTPCNDDDACTEKDTCKEASCQGAKVNCDDGNACTADSCDKAKGCKSTLIVSNACRPVIDIEFPPRAATIQQGSPTITVKGKVKSGAGPITTFALNDKPVSVAADGSFAVPYTSLVGGNTLVFDAADSFGSKKRRVQAYLWSSSYLKPDLAKPGVGMVDPGLAFWLAQSVIDDGNHKVPPPPNDLATLFELAIQNLKLADLIKNPVYSANGSTVNLTNLKYDPAKVSLQAKPGGLGMTAKINNVSGDLSGNAKVCVLFCFNVNVDGKLTMSSIDIATDVNLSVTADHKLATKMANTKVTLNNVDATLSNGVLNFLIGFIVDAVLNSFKPQLEKAFAEQVVANLEPQLSGALGALALNASFDINKLDGSGKKITLNLQSDFSSVGTGTDGLALLERARITTVKSTPYDNLGVPGRIGCGKAPQKLEILKAKPLELVIADDTFNQILWGTWQGGLFEFPVPASMLGNVDLAQYGVSDMTLKVSGMLAPTMSDCATGELLAHVGDFKVDAKLKLFGQPMDVVLYASFVAGVTVKAVGNEIGISLDSVKSKALQVDVLQDNMVSSEGVLEKLVADALLDNLVAQLGGTALGTFPIPSIDLSSSMPGLPPGTGIGIAVETTTRKNGNTIVGGKLK